MSTIITETTEIPDAPFYVMAIDRFMSGWGQARGKDNVVILPCEDREEAERVADYVESRPEQENVGICTSKPELDDAVVYSLMSRENAARWYRGGN